jgi:hypothetical protein
VHQAIFMNVMAFLVFAVAAVHYAQAPACMECSSKMRHRADCPRRRDGDA